MIHSSCEGVPCAVKRDCPKWGAISFYVLAVGGKHIGCHLYIHTKVGHLLTAQVNNKFTDE